MTKFQSLRFSHAQFGANWEPDIDDPGTPDEDWTGKWYTDGQNVDITGKDECILARYLSDLHNAAPALLDLWEAVRNYENAKQRAAKMRLIFQASQRDSHLASVEACDRDEVSARSAYLAALARLESL